MAASHPESAAPAIRPARVEDAPTTASIRVRGWQAAYRGQVPDELLDSLSVEHDTVRFADHVGHLAADRRVWVAESNGEVVGFASTGPSRDEDAGGAGAGEVYAIYVRPDLYGNGIGATLLSHAARDLAGQGYERAILWTLESNGAAQRFYERAGWRLDGSKKLDVLDGFELAEVRYAIDL
jgi:ribosomal protein S18 acetylase RimI-like enzyme